MKNRLALCLLLLLPALAASGEPTRALITFQRSSEVKADVFQLGDIASVKASDEGQQKRLEGLELGRSPHLGIAMPLNERVILNQLERLGLTESQAVFRFPDTMTLKRQSQEVDMKNLRWEVERKLLKHYENQEGEVLVEAIQMPRGLTVPAGYLEYETDFRFPRSGAGSVSFTVKVKVDGELYRRLSGTARVDVELPVLELTRSVGRGEPLGPHCWQVTTDRLSRLRGAPLGESDFQSVLAARRPLRQGEVLTRSMVEKKKALRRGDMVRLLLESEKGMRISTTGVAQESASVGDTVLVKNAKSGQRVQGVVVSQRQVRVPF